MSTNLLQLDYARARPKPHEAQPRWWPWADVVFLSLYSFLMLLVSFFLCFAVGHP